MSERNLQSTGYDVRFGKSQYFTAFEAQHSKFAIFSDMIASYDGPLRIDLPEYTVIILAPLSSKERLSIRAKSIILLDSLTSEDEEVILEYTGDFVNFESKINCPRSELIVGPTEAKNCKTSLSTKKKIIGYFERGIKNSDGIGVLDALGMIGEAVESHQS